MKTPKPSQWTDPPAASLRITLGHYDEQGLTNRDKTDWNGLADREAKQLRHAIGSYLSNRLPPDIEWSVATIIFTNRQGDDKSSVDFLSASTTPWDPMDQLQMWLDTADELDGVDDE